MPRCFFIAPDKFKGSLTAREAAEAIAAGIRRKYPDAELDLCPIADGGEGFMETLISPLHGSWISCPAVDAQGRPIDSRYLLAATAAGPTAFLEMAETAGLSRLTTDERDPLHATTRGVGMQIAHAIREHKVSRIILGLGGSATNDGGCGMAAALGIEFLDRHGNHMTPNPSNLIEVDRIDMGKRIALPVIVAACDVDHPLLGPGGATAVFGPQKGVTSEMAPNLETALAHLAKVSGGNAAALVPGAGAAGGLGFGLVHFAGAKLVPGFDLLADLLDLKTRILAADHVITGEGSLDRQSLGGKGPVALARLAQNLGVPVSAFCGKADDAVRRSGLFQSLHTLVDTGLPLEILQSQAASLLTRLVAASDW